MSYYDNSNTIRVLPLEYLLREMEKLISNDISFKKVYFDPEDMVNVCELWSELQIKLKKLADDIASHHINDKIKKGLKALNGTLKELHKITLSINKSEKHSDYICASGCGHWIKYYNDAEKQIKEINAHLPSMKSITKEDIEEKKQERKSLGLRLVIGGACAVLGIAATVAVGTATGGIGLALIPAIGGFLTNIGSEFVADVIERKVDKRKALSSEEKNKLEEQLKNELKTGFEDYSKRYSEDEIGKVIDKLCAMDDEMENSTSVKDYNRTAVYNHCSEDEKRIIDKLYNGANAISERIYKKADTIINQYANKIENVKIDATGNNGVFIGGDNHGPIIDNHGGTIIINGNPSKSPPHEDNENPRESTPNRGKEKPSAPTPKSHNKKIIKVIAGLVVLAIVAIAITLAVTLPSSNKGDSREQINNGDNNGGININGDMYGDITN